jgi:hypothetical protein
MDRDVDWEVPQGDLVARGPERPLRRQQDAPPRLHAGKTAGRPSFFLRPVGRTEEAGSGEGYESEEEAGRSAIHETAHVMNLSHEAPSQSALVEQG